MRKSRCGEDLPQPLLLPQPHQLLVLRPHSTVSREGLLADRCHLLPPAA